MRFVRTHHNYCNQMYESYLRSMWQLNAKTQAEMQTNMEFNIKIPGQERMEKVCLACGYSASTKKFCKHKSKGQLCPRAKERLSDHNPAKIFADLQEV